MEKAKVNKAKAVREYLASHQSAGPTAVAEALKEVGVTAKYVTNIKTKLKAAGIKVSKSTRIPKAGLRPVSDENNGYVNALLAAATFIKACGGVKEAKEAFRVAERVVAAAS